MPYKVESNGDGTYKVINSLTGRVHAARTTEAKAMKQVRLMEAIDHGGLRFRRRMK